jgi:putative transposase
MNRGNRRAEVFHSDNDYAAFLALLRRACARLPMRLLAYCLMPNHMHLVLWPHGDGDLGRWMQGLLTTHVHGYRAAHHSTGHVWQGRFKALPIEEDHHLLTVLRYVERNPLRAGLVERAEDWPWSSLRAWRQRPLLAFLDPGPVPRPSDWPAFVNRAETEPEWARLRYSVQRGAPFGGPEWMQGTGATLGLESSLRPAGRPRRSREPAEEQPVPSLFPKES